MIMKNGFKTCLECQCKLLAYLEKGRGLDDVINLLKKKRPDIEDIRKYAIDAIKVSTGGEVCDNYIVDHKLWYISKPKLLPEDQYKEIRKVIKKRTARGKKRLAQEKLLYEMLKSPDMGDLLLYWSGDINTVPNGMELPPELIKRIKERARVYNPWELAFMLPEERKLIESTYVGPDGETYFKKPAVAEA